MPVNERKVSRRDVLKASAILAAPFVAKYSRAAGPMVGKRMGYSMSFATIEWLVTQRRGVEEAAKALQTIIDKYPKTSSVTEAKVRLAELTQGRMVLKK